MRIAQRRTLGSSATRTRLAPRASWAGEQHVGQSGPRTPSDSAASDSGVPVDTPHRVAAKPRNGRRRHRGCAPRRVERKGSAATVPFSAESVRIASRWPAPCPTLPQAAVLFYERVVAREQDILKEGAGGGRVRSASVTAPGRRTTRGPRPTSARWPILRRPRAAGTDVTTWKAGLACARTTDAPGHNLAASAPDGVRDPETRRKRLMGSAGLKSLSTLAFLSASVAAGVE